MQRLQSLLAGRIHIVIMASQNIILSDGQAELRTFFQKLLYGLDTLEVRTHVSFFVTFSDFPAGTHASTHELCGGAGGNGRRPCARTRPRVSQGKGGVPEVERRRHGSHWISKSVLGLGV